MYVGQEQQPTRRTAYRLDGVSDNIGEARRYAEDFLRGCAPPLPPVTAQNALVVVSELVTNAIRHAPGPCTLELAEDGTELVIAVSDTSTVPPRPRPPNMAVGGGFGWHLVARFAARVEVRPDGRRGKTVRAVLVRDGATFGP